MRRKYLIKAAILLSLALLVFFWVRITWAAGVIKRVKGCVYRPDEMAFTFQSQPGDLRVKAAAYIPDFDVFYDELLPLLFKPVTEFEIFYFEGFYGDLGAELAQFKHLRRLAVCENLAEYPTEPEWKQFCTHLRTLDHLEELQIGGQNLSDAALQPLSGHAALKRLRISMGPGITPGIVECVRTMPSLEELVFEQPSAVRAWYEPGTQERFKAALPRVKVIFPG